MHRKRSKEMNLGNTLQSTGSAMELVYKENAKKDIPAVNPNKNKESKQYCMYTSVDTLTNKIPELKTQIVEDSYLS